MATQESTGRENTIALVSEAEAPPSVAEVYAEISESRDGKLEEDLTLSKLWRLFGNDPDLIEIVWAHMDHMYNGGSVPFELKSEISLVVASVLQCEGCRFYHESALEELGYDVERIEAIEDVDFDRPGFSPTEEVVLKFAQKAAEDPHGITDEDLAALRDLGFSEAELLEIVDCIAMHVYTAYIQGIAGIVYPGMSKAEWTAENA
ncbi:MAG: carboxymuconolactone decarboxylase family protein [Salinirussus sp.]